MLRSPLSVSVIIPVRNRADRVQDAIRSVLDQRLSDFELIVVDDGSTDNLADAVRQFRDERIQLLIHDVSRGAGAARNTGIGQARGRYCAFLDSDDRWDPTKLERQLSFMTAIPECMISCTAFHCVTPYCPAGEIRKAPAVMTFRHMMFGCSISPGSTMIAERSFLTSIGLFDVALPRLEDWDLLLRAARKTPIYVLNEPLSFVNFAGNAVPYEVVAASCERIRNGAGCANLPPAYRMILKSTIQNELAVAAYRNRQFGRAARHFVFAMLQYPRKDLSYFFRILRAVWTDFLARKFR